MADSLLNICYTGTLIAVTCPTCYTVHGIPDSMSRAMLANRGPSGEKAHCPNGHVWWYTGKSDADKLREQLDTTRRDADWQRQCRQRAEEDREAANRRLNATKGVVTRMKRRAKAGVCPCCNRTFSALAAHMRTQHPDYARTTAASESR